MSMKTLVRVLLLAGALTTVACGSDPCVTCSVSATVPDIGGVWTVSYRHSENVSVGSVLVEKSLILTVVQRDSMLAGRLGGIVETCTAQPNVVCTSATLYATPVVGRVGNDSSVSLSWDEDTTHVVLDGKAGAPGMTGTATGTSWSARPLTTVSVSQARLGAGDTVTVRGVITVDEGAFYPGNVVYIQDSTAGIEVIGLDAGSHLARGDSVLIRGLSGTDTAGEPALVPIAQVPFVVPPEAVQEGSGTVPAPRVVTTADLSTRRYEGSIVTLPSVRLVTLARFGGHVDYAMWFADANGVTFQVVVQEAVASSVTFESWTHGTYDITGILGLGIALVSRPSPLVQIRGPDDRVLR